MRALRIVAVVHGFQIVLPCSTVVAGRPIPVTIELIALHQDLVYAGLLEGVPTEELNQRLIEGAVGKAKATFGSAEPVLLAPEQEPLDIGRDWPLGKPATIPHVQCVALFRWPFPTPHGGAAESSSALTLVWFQKDFAMPIDGAVLEKIRALDWLRLATNVEW